MRLWRTPSCTLSRDPRRSPLMWVHSPSAASCAFFLSAYCESSTMTNQRRQLLSYRVQPQASQLAYRFIHRAYVLGTQTCSGNKPFQHPPLCFHHLRFFFLGIKTVVVIIHVSSVAWTVEEFVSMATSVWVKREYVTELSWEDKDQIQCKRQPAPYVRPES